MQLNKTPCTQGLVQHRAHKSYVQHVPVPTRSQSTVAHAKRRQLDRDYPFPEVYGVVVERLRDNRCLLVKETTQLIECIKTPEHAARCLDIIARYVDIKRQMLEGPDSVPTDSGVDDVELYMSDWPFRKRFLTRIAEIAVMELRTPQILFAIVGNMDRFKVTPQFGKDIIKELGQYNNVPLDILTQVATLVQKQRGPTHKATRHAAMALLEVMQDRGSGEESMAVVKQMIADTRAPKNPTAAAAAPAEPPAEVSRQPVSALA